MGTEKGGKLVKGKRNIEEEVEEERKSKQARKIKKGKVQNREREENWTRVR